MQSTLLIDADIVLHKVVNLARVTHDYGDGILHQYADVARGRQLMDLELASLRARYGCTRERLALSWPGERWRNRVYPPYKSGRDGVRPAGFHELFDYMVATYSAEAYPLLEADDLLGVWATGPERAAHVVWTTDKDLLSVPCLIAHGWDADPVEVTPEEADLRHLMATLTGDRVDDYPGCRGIGVTKAERLLAPLLPEERWRAIEKAFGDAGHPPGFALSQARVARILRDGEWDGVAVGLWAPPGGVVEVIRP